MLGKNPLPDDYNGTMSEKMIGFLKSGKVPINGDKDKAMRAVYEVVMGEGAGAGLESERLLPLGTDMTTRVKTMQGQLSHSLDALGHITNNVGIDK